MLWEQTRRSPARSAPLKRRCRLCDGRLDDRMHRNLPPQPSYYHRIRPGFLMALHMSWKSALMVYITTWNSSSVQIQMDSSSYHQVKMESSGT